MPSEKQIEAATSAIMSKGMRDNRTTREKAIEALTAAEQAEPTPSARSGAVKVKPLEWVRGWMNAEAQTDIGLYQIAYRRDGSFEWCFGVKKEWASSWDAAKAAAQADYERRILSALEPAEPEVMCVGCDGKPSLGNSPCAVCGKQAAGPATDVEPYLWLHPWNGSTSKYRSGIAADCPKDGPQPIPLFTRPPESLPKSVLERVERMVMEDREGKFNAVGVIQLLKQGTPTNE